MNQASSTKFGRQRDQRRALLKALAGSLILDESIKTTKVKAKAVVSYTERLITKAKVGSLHSRRQIISALPSMEASHKLVDELVPKLGGRSSGYLRIEKLPARRGDNAQMAKVSFVDNLKAEAAKKEVRPAAKKRSAEPKAEVKK